jgi:hypothetical protein
MSKVNITEVVGKVVDALTPLTSDERRRVVQASLTLLGEGPLKGSNLSESAEQETDGVTVLPVRARNWVKQNDLSLEQLQQVFHLADGEAEAITADVPGNTNREKVRNAYILVGIARLLSSGDPKFDDAAGRALCVSGGFYDGTNHMKYMKGGNDLTGSKEKGWTLTSPGLKRGAALVKELGQ